MTALLLWLFGTLTIASLIMVVTWGKAAREIRAEFRQPLARLVWCKPYVIAAALTLHALMMATSSAYRASDLMRGVAVAGSDANFLALNLSGLAISKAGFVWSGALDDEHQRVRWPWWGFLYALIVWALFCATWTAGYLT